MLKKLRLKFIILNMAIAAGVLAVAFITVCFANYQQNLQAVYAALNLSLDAVHDQIDALAENPSDTQQSRGFETDSQEESQTDSSAQNESANNTQDESLTEAQNEDSAETQENTPSTEDLMSDQSNATNGGNPPQIGGERGGSDQITPVAIYFVDAQGEVQSVSFATTASLSSEVLNQAIEELSEKDEGTGSLYSLGLYYEKRAGSEDGSYFLAFADMSSTSQWKNLIPLFSAVGIAALAAFLLISILFSRWALKPVVRAWDQQRRFVADASHDLKTPLTVIMANTSILLQHPTHSIEEERQWVESTRQEAADMQQLVQDLLLLAQVDEQALPEFSRLNLTEIVEAVTLQFESLAFERNIDFDCRLEEKLFIKGEATLITKLVSNLLENACKYANEGGQVKVVLSRSGKEARLSVYNSGEAIPPEVLPHIFERFWRADKARASTGGHGLGLAIALSVATSHGGNLKAESEAKQGTRFIASLPLIDSDA